MNIPSQYDLSVEYTLTPFFSSERPFLRIYSPILIPYESLHSILKFIITSHKMSYDLPSDVHTCVQHFILFIC